MQSLKKSPLLIINQKLALVVTAVVIFVAADQAAKLIWAWFYPPAMLPIDYRPPPIEKEQENDDKYSQLRTFALFGTPPVKPPPPPPKPKPRVVRVLPKITLSLIGILTVGDIYLAIIQSGGVDDTFSVGQYLGHLLVKKITKDSVTFENGGEDVVVYLNQENVTIGGETRQAPADPITEGAAGAVSGAAGSSEPTVARGSSTQAPAAQKVNINPEQKKKLTSFKKVLSTNPLQMLGKINTVPFREGGKIVGFQVSPGSERKLFFALQLQPGDIVTQINGQDLATVHNFTTGMRLMNTLSQQNTLDLLVRRGGSVERIFIDLR